MKAEPIRFRFNGPAVVGHTIDVVDLAPSLLALGELCKLTNRNLNKNRAAVSVLVSTDHEHECFELSFQLVQSLFDEVKSLLGREDIKTAKDILEWLGIVVGTSYGLFKLLAWIKGRKIESSELIDKDGKDVAQIKVVGDGNTVIVDKEVWDLAQDKEIVKNASKIVKPLCDADYDSIEFQDSEGQIQIVSKDDAKGISETANITFIDISEEKMASEFTARISVYAPVYDPNAKKWRFMFGDHPEYFDISETSIAQDAIDRGGALIDDAYKVKVRLTQTTTDAGKISNHYSIVSVENFSPAPMIKQQRMFENGDEDQ